MNNNKISRLRRELAETDEDLSPEQLYRIEKRRVRSRQRIAADAKRLEFYAGPAEQERGITA